MKAIPTIVNTQKAYFQSQKTKDVNFRLSLLKALKTEILTNETRILNALNKDFKKSEFEGYVSELGLVILKLNLAIKKIKSWTKRKQTKSSLLNFPSKAYIYKEPYGSVLIIAPWNYPFLLAIEPLIMAITAGNTVVLKPSELTQNTSSIITEIVKNVFPEGFATSIEGGVETATELLNQKWDFIFFTGSTTVGKIVAQAAAQHLTPVVLELGGKSPCIIDDTVDLKRAAKRLVWGKMLNGGQTCIAPDYIIAKHNIKQELIEALKAEITQQYGVNPKNSVDFPRIINHKNTDRLNKLLAGEQIIFGGESDENTCYIAPTLVDEPSLSSAIMQTEIFGPILPIITYETENDIETIIWSLEKPLSLYIFSKTNTFIERIINKFAFGGGVINDSLIHFANNQLPFGGVGASGMGKYHGKHGFDVFSNIKPIVKRGLWFDPSFRYAPYKNKVNLLKKLFKYFA